MPHPFAFFLAKGWETSNLKIRNHAVRDLIEIGFVFLGEMRHIGRQVVDGKDCALRTEGYAVAAINALVRVDEQLGEAAGFWIVGCSGHDGGGGALRSADKILDARIGNYLSHDETP